MYRKISGGSHSKCIAGQDIVSQMRSRIGWSCSKCEAGQEGGVPCLVTGYAPCSAACPPPDTRHVSTGLGTPIRCPSTGLRTPMRCPSTGLRISTRCASTALLCLSTRLRTPSVPGFAHRYAEPELCMGSLHTLMCYVSTGLMQKIGLLQYWTARILARCASTGQRVPTTRMSVPDSACSARREVQR